MRMRGSYLSAGLVATLLVPSLSAPAHAIETRFTLAGAIPNDVFLCAAERPNPEREFLAQYWGEVFDALKQCGIGEDALELIGSLLGEEQKAEVARLKERASQLLAGVNWGQLGGKETAFAERLPPPMKISERGIIMPVHLVWLFRGSAEGATHNFEGLTAILEAIVEEINKAAGAEALVLDRTSRRGAKVASVNLLGMVPGAPPLPIAVAQRRDVVLIALGEQMLNDVLGLLDGSSAKKALADDPRFQAAFAQLPPAEDSMVFFDMQALLKPVRAMVDMVVTTIGSPRDTYNNTGRSPEANKLTGLALDAYRQRDIKEALRLTQQAYDVAPKDSIVLYNLSCFHALLGDRDEALGWLEKAVEGGFYAPSKISSDPDLESLHGEPRYKAALARATELAAGCCVDDVVINSSKSGEAYKLSEQAWEVYKQQDYEQGLELVKQAYAVAPKDSRVLYYLACFHALLGHKDQALDFLEQAVDGGFYCPAHISKDPDLESIRSDERYEAALAKAKEKAAELAARQAADKLAVVKRLAERLMNAVGILDYAATVETTDGYAVWTESVTVLVPDGKERPIYPVFGKRAPLTDFDRFLPQETMSFSVSGGFDLGELYKFIEDTFRVAGPPGEELLAKWAEIQKDFGLDVKQDVIGWIDGGYVSVTLEGNKGSVWLIKVTDEQVAHEKVAAAVDFLSTKLGEAMAKNPALAMLIVRTSPTQDEQLEGFENLHFAMSPQPVVWGVADGHLIFGTSADAVALCLATARGEHPNIRTNARVMGQAIVPSGPFTSVKLTDRRGLGEKVAA
ncbi:MAG: tetratricopeptide repeat protein, partial [Phycisphaerae bacterium]